jgi:hypothetical protein
LVWQRDLPVAGLEWSDAKAYCESANYAGYCDWRLPSRIELASLVDNTKTVTTATLDLTAFGDDAPRAKFWSASVSVDTADSAWVVDFGWGVVFPTLTTGSLARARCVRGGDSEPSGARYELGEGALAGTVLDRGTGLRWEREYTSVDATLGASTCSTKTLAGFDDYRLPTMIELATIVDESRYDPALDTSIFSPVPQLYDYFMAREFAGPGFGDGSGYWIIDFRRGEATIAGGGALFVRCVRNE